MSSEKPEESTSNPTADWKRELEKAGRELHDRGSEFYHRHQGWFSLSRVGAVLASAAGLVWLGSGVYIVDQGNRGVVSRFGAYHETALPGPHWHWPAPLESVSIVNVEQQRYIEVGYDAPRFGKAAAASPDSLMLTRDENIIAVRLAVQYQIDNARDYLFNVKNAEATLKQLTESVLRAVIGRNDMDFVLTEGRSQIVGEIKSQIQSGLDAYHAGIRIASVNLQDAQPPEDVQGAFEDAIRAREDKQRLINEAEAYSNEIIPKARGAAGRIVQEAQAYAAEKIAKAQGETERFEQLLTEYDKSPAITRKRLYLEAKEKLYSNTHKILVETAQAPALYLPMAGSQAPANPAAIASEPAISSDNANFDKATPHRSNDLRPSRSKP